MPEPVSKQALPELDERAQLLLKTLVEQYIREGQPIGSRTLANESAKKMSPATIRNVMADLEEIGLVHSPHTSAGRIPTVQGYRLFVDNLVSYHTPAQSEIEILQQKLLSLHESEPVLESVSSLLSDITTMAGVVMLPRHEQPTLRQVEFLPLSGNRVLVILVMNEREVQNRIIHTSRAYSASELQQAANYLSQSFVGKDIKQARESLVNEMQEAQEGMNQLMLMAIEMANKAFVSEDGNSDFLMTGQTNLMSYAEMADVGKLRHLFEAFNHKRDILHLLDQSMEAEGVQIFIGEESGYEALDNCSVVTSPYEVNNQIVGVLGVIGPTRMAYDRVIPLVDITAKLLGAALNQGK
ncbi:MAG: heat-inducible transcriptional repressor HrcA [Gammaproteobacteria bacterium]|nr:heat-inducible transcriptional repressor HrcA [Gammaproteobacteria bacterium]